MRAQRGGHRTDVGKQAGKHLAIGSDDRILGIEHIERGRTGVGIDHDLDAVADVIDRIIRQAVAARVRISVGGREGVHQPVDPAVISHDHVRIRIQRQKRRQRLHAIAQIAPHQQPAVRADIVAERQLGQIAAVIGDQRTAQQPAEPDAAVAFVRVQIVAVALRVIEFLLPRLDVDVAVGELAEVDLRPRDRNLRQRALDRHVAEHQRRQPFRCEAIDRIHRDAVAVGVDQLLVDPVAAAGGQLFDIELARGQHHLPHRTADRVAIDVDVGKIVVGANLLDLAQRVLQRTPIPQADVAQRGLITRGVERGDRRLRRERMRLDAIERVSPASHLDVMLDEWPLAHQLIRLDDEAADVPADQADQHVTDDCGRRRCQQPSRPRCRDRAVHRNRGTGDQCRAHDQQSGQCNVGIGIGDAGKNGVVLKQPLVASKIGAQREHQQQRRHADRQAAPQPGLRSAKTTLDHAAGARGGKYQQARHQAGNHRQR